VKSLFSWTFGVGAAVSLLGCSSVEASKLPTGGYRIQCEKGMADCVARAENLCGGKGYTILGGRNATHQIGGSSSNYQSVLFVGELEIICGAVKIEEPVCKAAPKLPAPAVEPLPAAGAPTGAPACVPGASQACVGAAGCQGGQVCLADGSGFGACDCGTPRSSSPQSSPAGSAGAAPVAPRAAGAAPVAPQVPGAAPVAPQVPGATPPPPIPGAMPAPDALGTRR